MHVTYFYCPSCGFEDWDIYVAYVRQMANAELCECPECKKESSQFHTEDL